MHKNPCDKLGWGSGTGFARSLRFFWLYPLEVAELSNFNSK